MAPLRNFFVASLGLLSMATSVFAVNAGKTALSVTCFDTTGGVGGAGRLEKIAQEVDSSAVDAIIAGVGQANPNFSCAKGRGGGLTCKSSLRAANKDQATTEIRNLLTEVRSIEKAHLAANPPAAQNCGTSAKPAARRSLVSSVAGAAGKLLGKGKTTTAPKTAPKAAPAAAPKATSGAACTKPAKATRRGPPSVVAAFLARAHIIDAEE